MEGNSPVNVKGHPLPLSVSVDSERVWVTLDDQRMIGLPVASFPWLAQATADQQQNYRTNPISIYWPDLQEGIDMEYFTGEWSLSDT
jgi:hypothetical protein